VITDGVFSMRGDHAPASLRSCAGSDDPRFPRGCVLVVDDSHAWAGSAPRRGTEESPAARGRADRHLGKAMGVNGGYIACDGPGDPFGCAKKPLLPSTPTRSRRRGRGRPGRARVDPRPPGGGLALAPAGHDAAVPRWLLRLGFETIPGQHPVVPLRCATPSGPGAGAFLRENGVLATGLNYPVVPRGEQLIRFQVSADTQREHIDQVLSVLSRFK